MESETAFTEDPAALFERHRASLIGLAYRMLGSLAEAQDIAQDTYLRFRHALEVNQIVVAHAGAFLYKVAGRLCLDHLKSARVMRETYVGTWLPEPVVGGGGMQMGPSRVDHAHDISFALLLTLDRLTPPERAAFLLHDVFDLSFAEVAEAIGQEPESCRQLASRARRGLSDVKPRFEPEREASRRLIETFLVTLATGNVDAIRSLLAEDAVLYTDGGGKVVSALNPIYGADRIARFYVGALTKYPPPPQLEVRLVHINGLPGAVLALGGAVIQTFAFEMSPQGQIQTVYTTRNPEKLHGITHDLPTATG